MSLRKHLEHFAEHTSMHGFGKVILTKKPEKRVAWVIVFLSAWILFAYQFTSVLMKYFEYSKKTTTEFVSGGAPFPAITLCNMQSLDFYAMHKFMKSIKAVESEEDIINKTFVSMFGKNNSYTYHIALLYDLTVKYVKNNGHNLTPFDVKELEKAFSRTTIAENLPKNVLDEIAIKQDEFIVKCTFGNASCNFKTIDHSYFLKCFTFEPPGMSNTSFEDFQSLSEGIANGISVTLFTGTKLIDSNFSKVWVPGVYEKESPVSGSGAVRVVIHQPGTVPFPLSEGYDVPPGYQASLGIIPRRLKRLGKPYGNCDIKNRYKKSYLKELAGDDSEETEPYRKVSCERMCMQEQVIEECKCYDKTLPDTGDSFCDGGFCLLFAQNATSRNVQQVQTCRSIMLLELCALEESCDGSFIADTLKNIRCADNVINRLMTDLEALSKCNCYAPCDEFRYDVSYSLARWPSAGYESGAIFTEIFENEKFKDRFSAQKRLFYEDYINKEGMQAMKDFAKINVYVSDSNVLQTIEEPASTITQLISDIGGQLGIWIGVSVITISEIIETLLTIVTAGFRRLCCKRRGSKDDSESCTQSEDRECKVKVGPD